MTTDYTYLEDSVTRVIEMVKRAVAPTKIEVLDYIDPNLSAPFTWIYLDALEPGDRAADQSHQVWPLILRFVVGVRTQGYDGALQHTLYRLLPQVINYFRSHRRLCYQDDQVPPDCLDTEGVEIDLASPFGDFRDGSNHIGIELRLRLPFTLLIEEEY